MTEVNFKMLEDITALSVSDWSASDYIYPPVVAWDDFKKKDLIAKHFKRIFSKNLISKFNCHLYIHFPFCKSRCTFCRYFSRAANSPRLYNKFSKLIIQELKIWAKNINVPKEKIRLKTIYFGGGTPTLFNLNKIFETLAEHFPLNYLEQVNTETTPYALDGLNKLHNARYILDSIRP
jgi:coproporphyrinogen III oxidase-like Fe-S oxidoreductase